MALRRACLCSAAAVLGCIVVCSGSALAQARYPDRPIKLIVPYPPGGVYDAIGRPLAEKLKVLLGAIAIENVGGASGSRGAALVARSQPDGYTLMVGGTSEMVLVPLAANKSQYDPMQDFEPIARLGVVGVSFNTHPGVPAANLKELVAFAQANPGKLTFGSPGVGSLPHLTGELFKSMTNTPGIIHVPYAGSGPSLNDAVGGHILMAMATVSGQVLELHRGGKLKMLAVASATRLPVAEDVPTAEQAGYPGLIAMNFLGLFAPKGTPAAIVRQIAQATTAAVNERDLKQFMTESGFQADATSGPDQLRGFLQGELDRWAPVVKASGFKVN